MDIFALCLRALRGSVLTTIVRIGRVRFSTQRHRENNGSLTIVVVLFLLLIQLLRSPFVDLIIVKTLYGLELLHKQLH